MAAEKANPPKIGEPKTSNKLTKLARVINWSKKQRKNDKNIIIAVTLRVKFYPFQKKL